MDRVSVSLSVFFEDPFWIGVFERTEEEKLSVSKVTFGPEPKEYEVERCVLEHFYRLRFSPAVAVAVTKKKRLNPKRRQREVHKQMEKNGVGTKSWQALKLQQEQTKTERKLLSREEKEVESQRRFEQRQQKKKKKHKGR